MNEPRDFSLVRGGPLYQLWRRTRVAGDALELLHRRIIVLTAVPWVPLRLLSIAEGAAWGGRVTLPFLHDVDMHIRLVPFTLQAVLQLAAVTLAPVVPLTLTMNSLEELVTRPIGMVF